jgi:lipid-A-disaccharide synthase
VRQVRERVEEVLVILPFEEAFWRDHGVQATYVGSPVWDHLDERRHAAEPDVVGLLPGSRMGEIRHIWPLLVDAASWLAQRRPVRFLAPRAEGLPPHCLEAEARRAGIHLEVLEGRAQEVMERSRVCLVASGTATLECALVGTPMVVVYRTSGLTYALGKRLVKLPFVSLPNLIAGREVVPEWLQTGPEVVGASALELLEEGPRRSRMLADLGEVRSRMGERGASAHAAERIVARLQRGR